MMTDRGRGRPKSSRDVESPKAGRCAREVWRWDDSVYDTGWKPGQCRRKATAGAYCRAHAALAQEAKE